MNESYSLSISTNKQDKRQYRVDASFEGLTKESIIDYYMDLKYAMEVDYKLLKPFDPETNTRVFYRRFKISKGTSDRDGLFKQQK